MKFRNVVSLGLIFVLSIIASCKTLQDIAIAMNDKLELKPTTFSRFESDFLTHAFLTVPKATEEFRSTVYEPDFQFFLQPSASGTSPVKVYAFIMTILNDGDPVAFKMEYFSNLISAPVAITKLERTQTDVKIAPESILDESIRMTDPTDILNTYPARSSAVRQHLTKVNPEPTWFTVSNERNPFTGKTFKHRVAVLVPEVLLPKFGAPYPWKDLSGYMTINFFASKVSPNGETLKGPGMSIRLVREAVKNILVLGDSVMWGQGLLHEDKYSTRVAKEAAFIRRQPIRMFKFAHSGAVIKPLDAGESCNLVPRYPGEVSQKPSTPEHSRQRVPCQLEHFLNQPGRPPIDLVLLDGCANDVNLELGIGWILSPLVAGALWAIAGPEELKSLNETELKDRISHYCDARMQDMLRRLTERMPGDFWRKDPKIVVNGYYDPFAGPFFTREDIVDFGKKLSNGQITNFANFDVNDVVKLQQRSRLWLTESDRSLLNATKSVDPTGTQIRFAPVDFSGEHSYKGSHQAYWDFDSHVDPVRDDRRFGLCEKAGRKGEYYCEWAGVIHPNKTGADLYRKAIMKHLTGRDSGPFSNSFLLRDTSEIYPFPDRSDQALPYCKIEDITVDAFTGESGYRGQYDIIDRFQIECRQ